MQLFGNLGSRIDNRKMVMCPFGDARFDPGSIPDAIDVLRSIESGRQKVMSRLTDAGCKPDEPREGENEYATRQEV